MYGIEIVIPVSFKGPYGQRLLDFKKFGLLNVQDKKVLLTLLVGTEKIEKAKNGWPENVSINIISNDNCHEVTKIYGYLSSLKDATKSRWLAKFDDDSINDVSALVDKLDKEFDYTRDYYVITEFRNERWPEEENILRKLGYGRWCAKDYNLWHELEGSVISQAALVKILENEIAVKFLTMRAKIANGYTDCALAHAARIVKIFPSDAYFMSKEPFIGELSIFGGSLAHIHNISHDKNDYTIDLLDRMLRKDMSGSSKLYPEIVNKDFVYRNWQGLHEIHLNENGIIEGVCDAKIWHMKQDHLEFLRNDGQLIAAFDNYENTNFLKGYSLYPHAKGFKPTLRKLA